MASLVAAYGSDSDEESDSEDKNKEISEVSVHNFVYSFVPFKFTQLRCNWFQVCH